MVGLRGLEPRTSSLSEMRSNQLSYKPHVSKTAMQNLKIQFCSTVSYLNCVIKADYSLKGGDPAAPSDTATLLRLHPSHEPRRGNRPPCG